MSILQQKRPIAEALALLDQVGEADPEFAKALYLRGVCATRVGDPRGAVRLFVAAIYRGEMTGTMAINLARASTQCGLPDEAMAALLHMMKLAAPEQSLMFAVEVLKALGFATRAEDPRKDIVFDKLLLPFLAILLERRQMDEALQLENGVYEWYVKPTETETHFAKVMARMEPLFTNAGHYWRTVLPPLPSPSLDRPYKIGFFIHNASMLAHIEVMVSALKGYRTLDEQPFEPIVYCFAGRSVELERALAALDVRLVMLNEGASDGRYSFWDRLLDLRERIAADGVHELVWISVVTRMAIAFAMRIAPVQTWWAMKWRNFSQPDIDGYVTGSALTRYGTVAGRRFRMTMLGVDDWYDPDLEEKAAAMRAELGDRVVLMTLARTEKMRDPAYLSAIVEILQTNADAVFLWAGREASPWVTDAFRAGGVIDRTKYIGWVNTRLFAQVADIFLDTFPFPCGFTLFQAMAAGKPVVLYASPESAQTGLWTFLGPLTDGDEGTAEERAEVRALIGDTEAPLIGVARDPAHYVQLANRLIQDSDARRAAQTASRAFMARYFSDPSIMGRSLSDHLVELIEAGARPS